MNERGYRVYGYRWVVLAAFMFSNLTIQVLWISYAPVMRTAATYHGVTDGAIGWLTMSFMAAFIPLSLPVSWAIDAKDGSLTPALVLAVALLMIGALVLTRLKDPAPRQAASRIEE